MILINITQDHLQQLLACKRNTKQRNFQDWSIESLLNIAIFEMYEKYGRGADD